MTIHYTTAQRIRQEQPRRTTTAGRWITIRAKEGHDGKKHGGSPVFVQDGRIVKGHPSLAGRKIDALEEEPVEIGWRRQRDWHRGEIPPRKWRSEVSYQGRSKPSGRPSQS